LCEEHSGCPLCQTEKPRLTFSEMCGLYLIFHPCKLYPVLLLEEIEERIVFDIVFQKKGAYMVGDIGLLE
jgi:hypothetical protein